MGGKKLGIIPALAERDDRAEGGAFAETQEDFVSQILVIFDVIHRQNPL